MKLLISFLLLISFGAHAEKIDNMKLAKKLKRATGVQVDMNVEADDRCVHEQVSELLDQIRSFKWKTRKNLKAYIDNHFTGFVFVPTEKVGTLSGTLGKITLKEEFVTKRKTEFRNVTERVIWDSRVFEGGENVNSKTEENGKVKFLVKSADKRFMQYDFTIFQKKMNSEGKIVELSGWADKFRYPVDEISGLEVAEETSKKEMGSFECGKPLNWFDFGFEASF